MKRVYITGILILSLFGAELSYASPPVYMVNTQFGARMAQDGFESSDRFSGVYRFASETMFRNYIKDTKIGIELGIELGLNNSFTGRSNDSRNTTNTSFIPVSLHMSESLDVLAKLKYPCDIIKCTLAFGGNFLMMQPVNAVLQVESKFRASPKIVIGLEKEIDKKWALVANYHQTFNLYDGGARVTTIRPFELKGFLNTGMLTIGLSYALT